MAGSTVLLAPPPRVGCSEFLGRHGIFFAQVAFSMIGALFACIMLWRGQPAGQYLPVLTGIIGYWVPNPKSGKSDTPTTTIDTTNAANQGGGIIPTFIRRGSQFFTGKQRPDSFTSAPPAPPSTGAPATSSAAAAAAAAPTTPPRVPSVAAPPPAAAPVPPVPEVAYVSRRGNGAPTTFRTDNPELPLPPSRS